MNTYFGTNQNVPLTIGSLETFQETALLNGAAWNLVGGTATLTLEDPNGSKTILTASIPGSPINFATVNWTVTGPAGIWSRAWTFLDINGVKQTTTVLRFTVIASPP